MFIVAQSTNEIVPVTQTPGKIQGVVTVTAIAQSQSNTIASSMIFTMPTTSAIETTTTPVYLKNEL
jgi:hypothetical protein